MSINPEYVKMPNTARTLAPGRFVYVHLTIDSALAGGEDSIGGVVVYADALGIALDVNGRTRFLPWPAVVSVEAN